MGVVAVASPARLGKTVFEMVSRSRRQAVHAVRLFQSWPLWYVAVGLIGVATLPVICLLKPEWLFYSVALTTPLWIVVGWLLLVGILAFFANAMVWFVGLLQLGWRNMWGRR